MTSTFPLAYPKFRHLMEREGFVRVERDDRLLDILPTQTREKGVELWECQRDDTVMFIKLRLPYAPKRVQTFHIPAKTLHHHLLTNTPTELEK